MKELYIDEPAKWKIRELRQTHKADPVAIGSIVYRHDFLSIATGSSVYIWRNSLFFHFAGSSIYKAFIYGLHQQISITGSLQTLLHEKGDWHLSDPFVERDSKPTVSSLKNFRIWLLGALYK